MTNPRRSTAVQLAAETERERGAYLEQGRFLLAQIDAIDPRRIALSSADWCAAVQRMRTTILDQGRVRAEDLIIARAGWPITRDRVLPPAPVREPVVRSFTEPAEAP
jgi:hypothetical protein